MKEKSKINGRWLSHMDKGTKEWAKETTVDDLKRMVCEMEDLGEDVIRLKKLVQTIDEMYRAVSLLEDSIESEYLGIEKSIHGEVFAEA
ncbi:MAG: hypothetical protein M1481_03535 [Candidatus Thermoplasmatota archaeon]|nr:hypothetical protein [Candidatus Thermoplasmatota archaeon]